MDAAAIQNTLEEDPWGQVVKGPVLLLLIFLPLNVIWVLWVHHQDAPPLPSSPPTISLLVDGDDRFEQWSWLEGQRERRWRRRLDGTSALIRRELGDNLEHHPISQLSKLPGSGIVVYDQWEKAPSLGAPLRRMSSSERGRVILVDRSGTMEREVKGDRLNALARVYERLREKRKLEEENWRVFSFSDGVVDHGSWPADGPPPIEAFLKSKGSTRLLDALSQLQEAMDAPMDLVIITDGRIDTRDRASIEKSFSAFRSSGHRISMLSPTLGPLQDWGAVALRLGVGQDWPSPQKVESRESLDPLTGWLWTNVVATRALPHLRVLLWSSDQWPLAYIDSSGESPVVHLVATPPSMEDFSLWLQREERARFALHYSDSHLELVIEERSDLPLDSDLGALLPNPPGHYRWRATQWPQSFHHPSIGLWTLKAMPEPSLPEGNDEPRASSWTSFASPKSPEQKAALIFLLVCQAGTAFTLLRRHQKTAVDA